jgi:hypothetical protein
MVMIGGLMILSLPIAQFEYRSASSGSGYLRRRGCRNIHRHPDRTVNDRR